jgi:hypothetical protein
VRPRLNARSCLLITLLCFSLGWAGCGFDSLQKTVKLRLHFEVDGTAGSFESQQDYKPDDNADIKDNREILKAGVINVRSMSVIFTDVPDQTARFAWGRVYAYPKGTALNIDIDEDKIKSCKESQATACFDSVALVRTQTMAGEGLQRDGLSLDVSPEHKAKIVDLVLNHPELTVQVVGWTDQKDSPVTFEADVIFNIDVKASLL